MLYTQFRCKLLRNDMESSDMVLLPSTTDLPSPKLLAAKLPNPSQPDAISFTLYDRGAPGARSNEPHSLDSGCHVRVRDCVCWANAYVVPSNRWVTLHVAFDSRYLRVHIDGHLVDSARIAPVPRSLDTSSLVRSTGGPGQTIWAAGPASNSSGSTYIGGHPSYARSVREWRLRIGFVGLIASVRLWKTADALSAVETPHHQQVSSPAPSSPRSLRTGKSSKRIGDHALVLDIVFPATGHARDASWYSHSVHAHRNVFWRKHFPPIPRCSAAPVSTSTLAAALGPTPIATTATSDAAATVARIDLLDNFYHGAHYDRALATPKSFENLLLSVLQTGDVRVIVTYALDFDMRIGNEHGCRTAKEYELKSLAVVHVLEAMSPLLTVLVNEKDGAPVTACVGSFEIAMTLTRDTSAGAITIPLHSMASTSTFPSIDDIKHKIEAVILHEAKRCVCV